MALYLQETICMFFVQAAPEPALLETENRRPDVYMQNWGPSACRCGMFFVCWSRTSLLYTRNRIPSARCVHAELPRVRKKCFAYMQNWGACRCGMFFVLGVPEPALYILETEFPAPDVYMQNCRVYEKSVFRTCRIGVRVHVDVVCFSYKLRQNPPSVYY